MAVFNPSSPAKVSALCRAGRCVRGGCEIRHELGDLAHRTGAVGEREPTFELVDLDEVVRKGVRELRYRLLT